MALLTAKLAKSDQVAAKAEKPAKLPISAHPAFPAVVALWFAALFGLGCMVLPVALLESAVTASGLSSMIAAAEPPLGMTARLLISATAAIVGGAFGFWFGRKVADAQAPEDEGRALFGNPAVGAPTPISAQDELGAEGLGESGGKKRRSLAIAEADEPSDYMSYVPLPGGADASFDAPAPEISVTEIADALELSDLADEEADEEEAVHLAELKNDVHEADADETEEDSVDPLVFSPPSLQHERASAAPEKRQVFAAQAAEEPVAEEAAEPLDFSPPSFPFEEQAEPEEAAVTPAAPLVFDTTPSAAPPPAMPPAEPIPSESFAMPNEFEPEAGMQDFAASQPAAYPQDDQSQESLMTLAERLGGAIRKRKERAAAMPQPAPAAFAAAPMAAAPVAALGAEEFDPLGDDDVADAVASFFKKPEAAAAAQHAAPEAFAAPAEEAEPFAQPQAFAAPEPAAEPAPAASTAPKPPFANPFTFDDEDEDDDDDPIGASLSLPLGGNAPAQPRQVFAAPEPVATEADDGEAEDDASAQDFGSLTAMSNPFTRKQEFVRVDEPEDIGTEASVTFPAREPAATQNTSQPAPQAQSADIARPFDPPAGMKEAENPADREKAERELREALETLQRISGAA